MRHLKLTILLGMALLLAGCASRVQLLENETRVSQEQFRTSWTEAKNYRMTGQIKGSEETLQYEAEIEGGNVYVKARLVKAQRTREVIHVNGTTYVQDNDGLWRIGEEEVVGMWVDADAKTLLGSKEVLADLLYNPDVRGGVIRKDGKTYTVYQGKIEGGNLDGTWEMLVDQETALPSRIVWGGGGPRQVEMKFRDFGATDFHIVAPI